MRHEGQIVKRLKGVKHRSIGKIVVFAIVDKPAGHVRIQGRWHCVKEVLRHILVKILNLITHPTHLIHASDESEIGGCVIFGCNKNSVPLGHANVNHVGISWLRVDAIDLDDLHRVVFKPKVLRCECSHVDDVEHVRLAGLDGSGEVLCIVHQCCIRYWLCASRIGKVDELRHQGWYFIMIPVGQGEDALFVILTFERGIWVVDDQWSSQSIWILRLGMRVIPVRPDLIDLVPLV